MLNLELDKKYVNLVSHKLPLFKWSDEYTACFRCPFCGDSKRNKLKRRGYFYKYDDKFMFRCHNCGASHSFDTFLKDQEPTLHKEYLYEKFTNSNDFKWGGRDTKPKKVNKINDLKELFKPEKIDPLLFLESIASLSNKHPGKKYILNRKIPEEHWERLFYSNNYRKWVNDYVVKGKFKNLSETDERIIIPFYNKNKEVFAYQGRYIGSNPNITKYITIHEKSDELLIYGMERVDLTKRVYIVEGPIDSLFIDNCIAVGGSSLKKILKYKDLDLVFIFDNQPRNETICKLIYRIIQMDKKIVIFPDNVKEKDINDMVKNGLTNDKICDIIQNNTFNGLEAQLHFSKWVKCNINNEFNNYK